MFVAPLAGARIEIVDVLSSGNQNQSLPSRERGLKSVYLAFVYEPKGSLPSRERGLKLYYLIEDDLKKIVAPLAGARIEISPSTGIMAMT